MCLMPIKAQLPPDGGRPIITKEGDLQLPCGKCTECITKRAVEWATRCRHEISEHNENCFITLTYSEENLPSIKLVKEDFQKFMKRLRKHLKRKIRYIMCGEYGSKSGRPHFHAIIFGWNPSQQEQIKKTSKGYFICRSPELEKLWKHGFSSIGEANEKTAYYIASYALKGKKHNIVDQEGELHEVSDYMQVSKRPAIGLEFFKKNYRQIANSQDSMPRYYQKKLKEIDENMLAEYENRMQDSIKIREPSQLYAKYYINEQKISQDAELRSSAPDRKTADYVNAYLHSNKLIQHELERTKK